MWTRIVIILEVIGEDSLQMDFVPYDHVVQAFSAYGTNDAFAIGILPGRAWCDGDFFDPHTFDALCEVVAVDVVAITKEKTRCFLVWESVDDLLGGPLGAGIRGKIEMDNQPTVMTKNDKDIQDAKRHCGNSKEIAGGDIGNVIGQERPPRLRRRFPPADHVFGHGRFSDFMPQ